ncbi:MAG: Gfo/Idh/MocA family oxidoreductase [Pseudomonadota bacterium]
MSKPLSVAVLGAGYFSRFHIEAWQRHPHTDLVGVADHCAAKTAATGVANTYNALDAMLTATQPDILDIATPPSTHMAAITAAGRHPVNTVICQKPFCTSTDEAEAAVAFASAHNITLVIHENFRFQPWYRCMKACLDNDRIGQPLQMTFRLRTGDGQGGDAYLDRQPYFRQMKRFLIAETGVHFIDTFRYLFGPARSVYADLSRLNPAIQGEDSGIVITEHINGVRSVFDGNRLLSHNAANQRQTLGEAVLEGTHGTITLNGDGQVNLRRHAQRHEKVLLPAQQWPGFAGDCVYALQSHVAESVINGTEPENLANTYLPVLYLVDTIYHSAKHGTRIQVA